MNKQGKEKLRGLLIGAMLTAIGIMIPMYMPVRVIIPPASFTLASHVPVMIAMFFSPAMAFLVALGTTFGFFLAGFPITIVLRAFSHVVFVVIGAYYLKKNPTIVKHAVKFQVFNVIIALIHSLAETGIVLAFFALGFDHMDSAALFQLLLLIGIGGIVHSIVDMEIAFILSKSLNRVFPIDIFDRAKAILAKNKKVDLA
jgi:niacin transporter